MLYIIFPPPHALKVGLKTPSSKCPDLKSDADIYVWKRYLQHLLFLMISSCSSLDGLCSNLYTNGNFTVKQQLLSSKHKMSVIYLNIRFVSHSQNINQVSSKDIFKQSVNCPGLFSTWHHRGSKRAANVIQKQKSLLSILLLSYSEWTEAPGSPHITVTQVETGDPCWF